MKIHLRLLSLPPCQKADQRAYMHKLKGHRYLILLPDSATSYTTSLNPYLAIERWSPLPNSAASYTTSLNPYLTSYCRGGSSYHDLSRLHLSRELDVLQIYVHSTCKDMYRQTTPDAASPTLVRWRIVTGNDGHTHTRIYIHTISQMIQARHRYRWTHTHTIHTI